ncbi:MAG: hypothetical protein AAB691_01340, partial [Patescibacteria group bacterium]
MTEGIPPPEKKTKKKESDVEILRAEIRDLELQAKHPEGGIRVEGIEEKILAREAKLREAEKKGVTAPKKKKDLKTKKTSGREPVTIGPNDIAASSKEKNASKDASDVKVDNDRTPQEWRVELEKMVAAHERSKNEGGGEDWKEKYFAKRPGELDREAQKRGLESFFRSLGEKYNKLSWKSKLAVGLGLGVGTALFSSASLPAAIACMSGIAIQRTAGMASMFLKFEKNSHEEKWGKEKAMGKAVLQTAFMTAGMLVLIAGVKEGIDFVNQHNVGNATQEWLKQRWPSGEVDVSPPKTSASPEAMSPPVSTETAEAPPPVEPAPDESALALEKAQAATDQAFDNVKKTLDEVQKLASEQQVTIDKTVDDYGNDTLQIGDEMVPSNAEGLEELKAEVNADLTEHRELNEALNKIEADKFEIRQHVAAQDAVLDRYNAVQDSQIAEPAAQDISSQVDRFHSEIANLDTKIEDALGRRNALLGEYEAAGREAIESNQKTNHLYIDANSALENAKEHMEKYKDIIKNTKDSGIDAEEAGIHADIRGDQEVLDRDAEEAAKAYDDAKTIVDDKFKHTDSLKSQAEDTKNAYEDIAAQKKAALEAWNADKMSGHPEGEIQEDLKTQGGGKVIPEAPFGRDANGHPLPSAQEAKDYDDLVKKGIRDPRETGAWPPESPQEKGFVEKLSDWFNEESNTTDSISPPA